MGALSAPALLTAEHDCSAFACGEASLDHWLRVRALRNQESYSSRTFVVCDGLRVVGYYLLATGAVARAGAPSRLRRESPDPIPVILIGRLAVDGSVQRAGVGKGLLRDALFRALTVSQHVGARAVLVHAISESACAFYRTHGFMESPGHPMALMMPMASIKAAAAFTVTPERK